MEFGGTKFPGITSGNSPANAGDIKDAGSIPVSGRPLGEGNGNPLQFPSWRISWTERPGELQSTGS